MKNHRLTCWSVVVLPLVIAYFWFFSPELFRDCIHVVLPASQTDAISDGARTDAASDAIPDGARMDAASGRTLTEDDYRDLFHMEKSEYKIAWKFFGND